MKKLNRKGFTLVELLAVIVILAIVVGITLVTVLPTLKDSRKEAFELTAQTAADFLEKEYQLYVVGQTVKIPNLESGAATTEMDLFTAANIGTQTTFTKSVIEAAGLKEENYNLAGSTWKIDTLTGRVCVKLTAATRGGAKNSANGAGEYYDAYGTDAQGKEDTTKSAVAKSSACTD